MHVCFGVEITPLRYSLIGCLASLIIYLAFLGGIRYKFPSHELKIDTATQTTTPTETKSVRREEVIETIGPEILDTNAINPIPQGYADAELQTDLTTPCDKAVGTDESDGTVVQTLRGYANAELQTEGISTREEAVGAIDPEVVYSNAAMQTHSEYADSNLQTEDFDLATLYPGINTLVERETAVSSREKLAAGHEEELGRYASHLERLADTIAMKEDAVKKREIETYFAEKYVEAWMKNLVGEEEKLGRSRRELSDREFDLEKQGSGDTE
ncbi:hypothetical protein ONZ45_g19477 [Pleurotus djamor]|nr:hypothetical protein ONZ45_g19477 [Pleurotus djamor]